MTAFDETPESVLLDLILEVLDFFPEESDSLLADILDFEVVAGEGTETDKYGLGVVDLLLELEGVVLDDFAEEEEDVVDVDEEEDDEEDALHDYSWLCVDEHCDDDADGADVVLLLVEVV